MSIVRSNTYQDASGGSNAVFSGVASPPNSMGFRNRILNGGMVIDQRNAGASVTPTADGTYTLDRWQCYLSQASKYSVQQNAGSVTPPAGFTNYLGITSTSAYSVLSSDYFAINQRIEGFNFADLGWGAAGAQPVTISFWVRSSLTGTFGGSIVNSAENRSYPFSYTVSAANTWEQKTVTVTGDTSGTWVTNNGIGARVYWAFGVGSTGSGTAGAWTSSNLRSATGAVSVVGTNGATFYITGVQLEAGTNASAFERRDYGRELMMCQRYCEKSAEASEQFRLTKARESDRVRSISISFKAEKRATPTITLLGANGDGGGTPATATITSSAMRLNCLATADTQTPWVNGYLAESEL